MLERFLNSALQQWMIRGGRTEAESLGEGEAWALKLNRRSVGMAGFWFLLFLTGYVAVGVLQQQAPQPRNEFLFLAGGYTLLVLLALYNFVFHVWYRVTLTREGIFLRRFLLPTRFVFWEQVTAFRFKIGDELLKIDSQAGHTLSLYLTLDGLSMLRRSLAAKVPMSASLFTSWLLVDPLLLTHVPGWKSDGETLGNDDSHFSAGPIHLDRGGIEEIAS